MKREFFTDGIRVVRSNGNRVCIDVMALQPQRKRENGQPVVEVNTRIIMPLEGYAQYLEAQENIAKISPSSL